MRPLLSLPRVFLTFSRGRYMNHLAFNGANGQTVVFFVAHALATISYSFAARHFSRQLAWCPRWLGVLAVNIFAFSTTPMFTGPFARVGFFEGESRAGGERGAS